MFQRFEYTFLAVLKEEEWRDVRVETGVGVKF